MTSDHLSKAMFWGLVIMLVCGRSSYYARNLSLYFSKLYETTTRFLQEFFDKSDRLFEWSVIKCAILISWVRRVLSQKPTCVNSWSPLRHGKMCYLDRNLKQYDCHAQSFWRANMLCVWNMFCVEEPAFACCIASWTRLNEHAVPADLFCAFGRFVSILDAELPITICLMRLIWKLAKTKESL